MVHPVLHPGQNAFWLHQAPIDVPNLEIPPLPHGNYGGYDQTLIFNRPGYITHLSSACNKVPHIIEPKFNSAIARLPTSLIFSRSGTGLMVLVFKQIFISFLWILHSSPKPTFPRSKGFSAEDRLNYCFRRPHKIA